jgi:hypothetical protein
MLIALRLANLLPGLTFNVRGHWDEFAVAIRALGAKALGMARRHSPRHPF